MNTQESIATLFDLLSQWRKLPAYQLERRADIYFALYLEQILATSHPDNQFDLVIPEFPLRLGSLRPGMEKKNENRSVKVDYACFDTENGVCVLLELKTDEGSVRDIQNSDMLLAKKARMGKLLQGLGDLRSKSTSKAKYDHLLGLLQQARLVHIEGSTGNPFKVSPTRGIRRFKIKLAVIKPGHDETIPMDKRFKVITFQQVRDALEPLTRKDQVAHAFHTALGEWELST